MDLPANSKFELLPTEIIGEVIAHSASYEPDAPLKLRLVSRHLQRTVQFTPGVWTYLNLDVRHLSVEGCLRKGRRWFSRAGARMVHVKVWTENEEGMGGEASGENFGHGSPTSWNTTGLTYPSLFLAHFLRDYALRVRTLSVHSISVDQAQMFLSAMYSLPPTSAKDESPPHLGNFSSPSAESPLEDLILLSSSEDTRIYASNRPPSPHTPLASGARTFTLIQKTLPNIVILPPLPHLTCLDLTNQPLPSIDADTGRNIRNFRFIYPLRFSPLHANDLMSLLESLKRVEVVEIEGRISLSHGQPNEPSGSTNHTTPSPFTLPLLNNLSLRANNLPSILSSLILPSLHTLKVDDLDGKRVGSATEMGALLRGLLVRMELPCSDPLFQVPKTRGLQLLDLTSVGICGSQMLFERPEAADEPESLGDDGAVWQWCLRRMKTLKELRVKNMDARCLVRLITPPVGVAGALSADCGSVTSEPCCQMPEADILSNLAKLVISSPTLQPSQVSIGLDRLLDNLQHQRPSVRVVCDLAHVAA